MMGGLLQMMGLDPIEMESMVKGAGERMESFDSKLDHLIEQVELMNNRLESIEQHTYAGESRHVG